MDNIDGAIENLKQMLASNEGQETISSLIGAFSSDKQEDMPEPEPAQVQDPQGSSLDMSTLSPDMMMKMTQVFGALQNRSGPHFDLLYALRPYLSAKKQGRFEVALRMLQLSKLPDIKNLFSK